MPIIKKEDFSELHEGEHTLAEEKKIRDLVRQAELKKVLPLAYLPKGSLYLRFDIQFP